MQAVDEFKPSTTEPVFGSGLISQTKIQQQANNNIDDSEKVIPPPAEPVVNGQNDAIVNKVTSNENVANGITESVNGAGDSSAVHVNGEHGKATVETIPEVKPVEEPKPMEVEPIAHSIEPVLSTPVETANEGSSAVSIDHPPAEATTNDHAPEITESESPERKSKVIEEISNDFILICIFK
jgi:hypothetical protein